MSISSYESPAVFSSSPSSLSYLSYLPKPIPSHSSFGSIADEFGQMLVRSVADEIEQMIDGVFPPKAQPVDLDSVEEDTFEFYPNRELFLEAESPRNAAPFSELLSRDRHREVYPPFEGTYTYRYVKNPTPDELREENELEEGERRGYQHLLQEIDELIDQVPVPSASPNVSPKTNKRKTVEPVLTDRTNTPEKERRIESIFDRTLGKRKRDENLFLLQSFQEENLLDPADSAI